MDENYPVDMLVFLRFHEEKTLLPPGIFNTILLLIWTSADPNCNASLPVGATLGRRHVFRGEQIPTGSIPVSIQL